MSTDRRTLEGGDIEARGSSRRDIDIDKWAGSLAKILEEVPPYMCIPGHPGRISRIPETLREIDVKAYEPYFLSIGPYHHDKTVVQPMERTKWMVLKYLFQVKPEITLKDYLNEIKGVEQAARSFYSNLEMESEKFVLMLLLDSIYLLSLFCGMPENHERLDQANSASREGENMSIMLRADDYEEAASAQECGPRFFSPLYTHDLFLLENQVPFFLLEHIYAIAYGGSKIQLLQVVKATISNVLLDYTKLDSELVISSNEEVHHILHLCHMFFRPTIQQESISYQLPESSQMFRLESAVQLYKAGVKFVARSDSSQHSLLDITFTNSGKMVMPCLPVDDNTNSLLRNLIALEQMKYPILGLNVTAYAVLLLHLVTTPKDAKLLRRKGMIEHHLASDKEMMYLVNRLSVGLSFDYAEDNYSLKAVFQELKRLSAQSASMESMAKTHIFQQSLDNDILDGCIYPPHPLCYSNLLYCVFLLPTL